jgi:hypothetical protein
MSHFCLPIDNGCLSIYVCIMVVNVGNNKEQGINPLEAPKLLRCTLGSQKLQYVSWTVKQGTLYCCCIQKQKYVGKSIVEIFITSVLHQMLLR